MPILLDTSAIVAAMSTRETHHAEMAAAFERAAGDRLLLPVTILAETMSFVRARYGLEQQRRVWDAIAASGIEIVGGGATLAENAREIDRAYGDAGFGFADCTLLATCEQERIARVLSFDRRLAAYRPSFAPALEVLP